jgi:predicted MFS family arabinose efflux permease
MLGNQLAIKLGKLFKGRYGLLGAVFQVLRGIFLILLAIQTSAFPAMLFFWLVYLNMGILTSPLVTLFNNEIPAERRSSLLSIGSLLSYLGSIAGSTALGYVAEKSSIGSAWGFSGVALILASYLYLRVDTILMKRRGSEDDQDPVLETG